jgi:hypothetical protein
LKEQTLKPETLKSGLIFKGKGKGLKAVAFKLRVTTEFTLAPLPTQVKPAVRDDHARGVDLHHRGVVKHYVEFEKANFEEPGYHVSGARVVVQSPNQPLCEAEGVD